MPLDFSQVADDAPAPPTPPSAAPPAKGPGISISDIVKAENAPSSAPSKLQNAGEALKTSISTIGHGAVQPYLDDLVSWSHEYLDALHQDLKAYPEGTGNQVLQSLKTANDALGFVTGPVMSPVYTGIIDPLKKGMQKLGDLVSKHAASDIYNAQARRERDSGQQYPKGIDWEVHKEDVQRTVEGVQTASEAFINAAVGMAGGEGFDRAKVPERPVALARAAVRDFKSAVEPPSPKLEPIAVSLDKQVGFQKIAEKAGLEKIAPGAAMPVASVFDSMLPHAEGYAKGFLEKLQKSIDPNLSVKFKRVAGFDEKNLGIYVSELNQIEILAGQHDAVHTTVHELVHAATVNTLDNLIEADLKSKAAQLGRELTPAEKVQVVDRPSSPILKELDSAIREARVRAQKAGLRFYGLKGADLSGSTDARALSLARMSPRYEFVSEIFSNPKLQEFLANSEKYASAGYKVKNILNQFTEILAKHFGMTNPEELNLLNHSMAVGSRLLKLQEGQPATKRSIYQVVAKTKEGETITSGDIKNATIAKVKDPVAGTRARSALSLSIEQILRAIAPEALGKNAKLAAAVVASRITEQMQRTSAWRHGSDTRLKFWRARPDMQAEFINKFEKGEKFSDPVLQDLAEKYRTWGKEIFEQDQKISGLDYEPRDNYLYHIFEDSEGVSNYFNRKYGSKWGDPKFIKDRTFDLYKEAIAAGFRPKFDSPEDIFLARQHASDIAAMHTGILKDLEKYGLATAKVKGTAKIVTKIDAEGKAKMDLEKTVGNKQPPNTIRWRAPNGQVYWVDQHADVILSNAFKSKSLWEDKTLGGTAFRGLMAMKNALVPIRLAISLFHPLHVAGIDMAAGWTRTAAGMLSGSTPPVKALGEFLRSGFGPLYENPKAGWRLMQVWKGLVPELELTAADAEALHYIVEGGMIPEMSSQYRLNARANFMNALRDAQAGFRTTSPGLAASGAGRAVWHLPWATISAMSAPIFEHWIPALKTASYLKDVKSLLQRNPELAENDALRQLALRKLAKSVDNRYGEMAYNTLFWKRWIKDVAVLDTLSLGWQLGFLREYGGGAMDVGQFAVGEGKLQRIKSGQLDRPLFVASYTALGAGTAGLMTWAMTGEYPKELLDWVAPQTGEKNPDGSPQRVNTMFYSREFAALYKHVQNEGVVPGVSQLVLNKGSGLFGLMHEWTTGLNSFGQEIRDPNSDAFEQLEQTLAYTMTDLEPISMKAIHENAGGEASNKGAVLSILGFTPAPKYLTEGKTVADIKSAFDKYVAPKQTPYDRAQYSKEYSSLRQAYQSGDQKFGDVLDSMVEKYELSASDQRRIMKSLNSDLSGSQRMFMRLPWQQQKDLLDKMTEEERQAYLPHSNRTHVRNVYTPPPQ